MSGTIFNIPEPTGAEAARLQTTAGIAQTEAHTASEAREVEQNSEQTHEVAENAAFFAQTLGPGATGEKPSLVSQLQQGAKKTTDAAVAEDHHDVDAAKATGAGYVDQAKALASSALATAQTYLPESVSHPPPGTTTTSNVVTSLQAGATAALDTTKEYIASAQASLQPHVDAAKAAAQPHIDSAKTAAEPHVNRAKNAAQSYMPGNLAGTMATGIPATSAPLESGAHTVDTPYSSTSVAPKIGDIERK